MTIHEQLVGLMEKAEKHGALDEFYRQVKAGKHQEDDDMFSWVSSEEHFEVPKMIPKEYWCEIFWESWCFDCNSRGLWSQCSAMGQDKAWTREVSGVECELCTMRVHGP